MTVYTEDTLVQQTTVDYLEQQLKWESVYAYNNEDFGPGNLLGRASDREVVLTRTLREKLEALNPSLRLRPATMPCGLKGCDISLSRRCCRLLILRSRHLSSESSHIDCKRW